MADSQCGTSILRIFSSVYVNEPLEEQNEKLRIEAYAHKTMDEIAEKEFQIPIRKKSGANRIADRQ